MQTGSGLICVDSALVKTAAAAGAAAFRNDPYMAYFFPAESKRHLLADAFGFYIRTSLAAGEHVYAASPRCEGMTIWLDTRDKEPPAVFQCREGMRLLLKLGPRLVFRLLAADSYLIRLRNKLVKRPHVYLALLAVRPEYQGKGFASKLVKPALEYADAERLPCYLETQNRKNVSLYRHFGFEVIYEGFVPRTPVYTFSMIRKAR
jgi:GNAT superfamily N-acetyltransferase